MGQAGPSLGALPTSPAWQYLPPRESQKPSSRWVSIEDGGSGKVPPSIHQLNTILGDFLEEGDGLVSPNPQGTITGSTHGQSWGAGAKSLLLQFHIPDSRYSGVPRERFLNMRDLGQLQRRDGR